MITQLIKISQLIFVLFVTLTGFSQQWTDTLYIPIVENPVYETGKGPLVYIDEAHHNVHTKESGYKAFSEALENDGYNIEALQEKVDSTTLKKCEVLVIANALNEINVDDWILPTPSAFSNTEIKNITEWVENGGSLFLIADHMPMPGAASELASMFGFHFTNGVVFDTITQISTFKRNTGSLENNLITNGKNEIEKINVITSFIGQGFQIPEDAISVLTFDSRHLNYVSDTAMTFNANTKINSAEGWSQLAYKKYGRGKIIVSGEAAMFSAQIAIHKGKEVNMGMNNKEYAPDNLQLLLNIIHWLDGNID